MGLIEKSIRNRANQKLAAPLYTNTPLSPDQVVDKVVAVCHSHNRAVAADVERRKNSNSRVERARIKGTTAMMSSYLTSVRQGPELLIGFSRTPDQILADKRKTQGFMAGHWLAQVRFPAPDPEVPPGQTVVEMRLVKWVVDSNGRMNNRNFYESLVDAVHNALSSVDTPATD